jgi:protein-tyrosine phosphatase
MIRITFVCLGNICRSPMAEFIFKKIIREGGISECFSVSSAATSDEEEGNPVYPPAAQELKKHGIDCAGKRARKLTYADFEKSDYFICMDRGNIRATERIFGTKDKQYLLLSFAGGGEIADPWYTRDFTTTYLQIENGCREFLNFLVKKFNLPIEK